MLGTADKPSRSEIYLRGNYQGIKPRIYFRAPSKWIGFYAVLKIDNFKNVWIFIQAIIEQIGPKFPFKMEVLLDQKTKNHYIADARKQNANGNESSFQQFWKLKISRVFECLQLELQLNHNSDIVNKVNVPNPWN